MQGQMNILDFMQNEKPPVGSTIYFATGMSVYRAVVVNHNPVKMPEKYFEVKTIKGNETYYLVQWYSSKEAAEEEIRKYWSGRVDYR